ncbi:MAG: YggT family protein [Chloroflexota bacterium]
MQTLITFVSVLQQLLALLVIVSVILSYFMDPYHPIRRAIDGIVEPMLSPIRRVIPRVGMLDFSPLVLILLIQLISGLLIRLIHSFS